MAHLYKLTFTLFVLGLTSSALGQTQASPIRQLEPGYCLANSSNDSVANIADDENIRLDGGGAGNGTIPEELEKVFMARGGGAGAGNGYQPAEKSSTQDPFMYTSISFKSDSKMELIPPIQLHIGYLRLSAGNGEYSQSFLDQRNSNLGIGYVREFYWLYNESEGSGGPLLEGCAAGTYSRTSQSSSLLIFNSVNTCAELESSLFPSGINDIRYPFINFRVHAAQPISLADESYRCSRNAVGTSTSPLSEAFGFYSGAYIIDGDLQ